MDTAFQETTFVCENIGPAERAKRKRVGWVGAALTIVGAGALVALHLGWPWRLLLGLPAMTAAMGFFQARAHTCVAFVASGVKVMGDSMDSAQKVTDPAERAAFRKKALVIYAQAIAASAAVVALVLALP